MNQATVGRNPLTVLSRIARRKKSSAIWLDRALEGDRLAAAIDPAIDVVIESGEPLASLLHRSVRRSPDPQVTNGLLDRWDSDARARHSLPLAQIFSHVMSETCADIEDEIRRAEETGNGAEDGIDRESLAAAYGNLVPLHHRLGRAEPALFAARRSAELYEELGTEGTPDHGAALALARSNLAALLLQLDRPSEAIPVARQAISAYRDLSEREPETHDLQLSSALNILATSLDDAGRPDEAVGRFREALEIGQRRGLDVPESRVQLARALGNLAVHLRRSGDLEEAERTSQEAISQFERLAATYPDVYRGESARNLLNRALLLRDLDRVQEAYETLHEAIRIQEDLRIDPPDPHDEHLADSLRALGNLLKSDGRYVECREAFGREETIRRELAGRGGSRNRAAWAESLIRRGEADLELGGASEAIGDFRRGLEILRPLARDEPQAHSSTLTRSLVTVGRAVFRAGLEDEAPDLSKALEEGLLRITEASSADLESREKRAEPLASSLLRLLQTGTVDPALRERLIQSDEPAARESSER